MEALRSAAESIRGHKLRSFLTLLGVIIGVTTVVVVSSVISGLNRFVAEQVFQLSPDVFGVSQFGIITSREDFLAAVRRKPIEPNDVRAVERLCRGCDDIGVNVQTQLPVKLGSERHGGVTVFGATANMADLNNLDVEAGRFYTKAEEVHSERLVVIGSGVRERLFGKRDPIGRSVTVAGNPMKVIGLLRKQGSILGQSQDNQLWMPLSTYRKYFASRASLTLFVRPQGGIGRMAEVQDEVRVILRNRRRTPFKADDPFGIVSAEGAQNVWEGVSAGAFGLMVALSGMSLVVGGIVIMNIMLVSVVERTREIGIRRALGARQSAIRWQFLSEAMLLSLGGGMLGVGLGIVISRIIPAFAPVPTNVPVALVMAGLMVSVVTGGVAGFVPARRAARLDPVEALRHE